MLPGMNIMMPISYLSRWTQLGWTTTLVWAMPQVLKNK